MFHPHEGMCFIRRKINFPSLKYMLVNRREDISNYPFAENRKNGRPAGSTRLSQGGTFSGLGGELKPGARLLLLLHLSHGGWGFSRAAEALADRRR